MMAYRTNKNCTLYVGVQDVNVVKDALRLENLHINLAEYQNMFHYELTLFHESDITH
jgi:hypothetical protein